MISRRPDETRFEVKPRKMLHLVAALNCSSSSSPMASGLMGSSDSRHLRWTRGFRESQLVGAKRSRSPNKALNCPTDHLVDDLHSARQAIRLKSNLVVGLEQLLQLESCVEIWPADPRAVVIFTLDKHGVFCCLRSHRVRARRD